MSRIYVFLIISGLLLFVAACTSENDAEEDDVGQDPSPTEEAIQTVEPEATAEPTATEEPAPTSTPEPEPTATETPVETPTPSEDDTSTDEDSALDEEAFDEGEDPFGTVPEVYIEDFHDEALSERLLGIEEMPEGWDVIVEGSLADDAEATQGLGDMMSGPCDSELLTPERMGNPSHVGRSFMGQGLGPMFSQDLYQFDDATGAEQAFELARDQLDCDEWTAEDPTTGMEFHYTVEDLEFPELGDESLAITLNIGTASETQAGVQTIQQPAQFDDMFAEMSSQSIMVRQGEVFTTFTYMDWFGDGSLNLEETVTQAVERISSTE
jgi:hypothetical protein